MIKTEIKIYASNIYYSLDLYDDEPVPLTKSIIDIKEPDKRQSDFTKTIKLPGTANNNQIFSNIFEVSHAVVSTSTTNFDSDFNPNLKANAILFREGIPILRGYLQLTDIILNDEQKIDYEVIIIGRNANLFQDLGDKMLQEVDLSAYDHDWTEANQLAKWGAPTPGLGYVYPIIERGYGPDAFHPVLEQNYYVDETFPAVYVKTIVDAIFLDLGYRYSSAFFDSARFKSLIVPFSGDTFKPPEAFLSLITFELAYSNDTAFIPPTPTGVILLAFNQTVQDTTPAGVTGSSWVVPSALVVQSYLFNVELSCTVKYVGVTTVDPEFTFTVEIVLQRGATFYYISSFNKSIQVIMPGIVNPNDTMDFSYSQYTTVRAKDQTGDIITAQWNITNTYGSGLTIGDFEIKFKTGSRFYSTATPVYGEGDTISIRSALPSDLRQSDFLMGLVKMFNLYFEPDPIDDKKLLIEPREDYLTSTVVDFTSRLDVYRDIVLKPMGALDFKTLEFHYQTDEDQLNTQYNKSYPNEYGFKRVVVSNDFIVEKKLIELPFASTPLADSFDRIITKIAYFNSAGEVESKQSKIRILIYGGTVTTGAGTFFFGSKNTLPIQGYESFPYAGHLDNTATPTFDLCWGIPQAIFYGTGKHPYISNNNLFNIYWSKYISEITDKDSKIMICYLHLLSTELQNISFKNLFLIDRQYYRLHKIEYDLNSNEPAKCEFLKLKTAPVFVASSGTVNGGTGQIGDEQNPNLVYYNPGEYEERKNNLKFTVSTQTGEEIWVPATSQMVLANNSVHLPEAAAGYDLEFNNSIEILIYNTNAGGGASITVYYNSDSLTFTIIAASGGRFLTDGLTWFMF